MKKTIFAQSISLIISICLGIYCVYRVFNDFFQSGEYFLFALSLGILVAQILLASIFHELGHMLFGALVKIKARPHFRLILSSEVELIPLTDKDLRGRVVITALGGCIVNFLFVILGVVALAVPAVPTYLSMLAPPALYLGLFNILPVHTGSGKTDGLIISELARGEDSAKVMIAVMTVQAQVMQGKPLSEIDKSLLFDLPVIREDDPSFIALMQLRRDFYQAVGDADGVKSCDERLADII